MLFKNKELFSNTNNKLNNVYQITKIKKNIFKSDYPIFVNFYTGDNGYRKYSDKLIKSLKKFNLPYYIIEINSNKHKWTLICQQKPFILLEVMNKYPNKNVVWVDADAIIEKEPELFKNINKSFGVHYIGGHEFASGTLFFKNNNISRNIINDWIKDNEKNSNAWDQIILGKIINKKYKKHEYKLPKEYCSIFDKSGYKNIDRVISHWQASRELKYNNRIENFTNLNGNIVLICCNDSYVPKSIIALNNFTSFNPEYMKVIIGTHFKYETKKLAKNYNVKLIELDLSNDFQKLSKYPIECFYHFYAYKLFPNSNFIINIEADIITNKKIDINLNSVTYIGGSYDKKQTINKFHPIMNDYNKIKKIYGVCNISKPRILGGVKVYNIKNLVKINFYEKILEYYKQSIKNNIPRRGDDSLMVMYQMLNPSHIKLLKPEFNVIFQNEYKIKDIIFFHSHNPKYWKVKDTSKLNNTQLYFYDNIIEFIYNEFSLDFIEKYIPEILIEKYENLKKKSIRIICLCTSNYDKIGCYGANSLKYYSDKHNYKFTLYRDKIVNDLHINFSKNAIILDACNKYDEDYIVCVDTDIIIENLNIKIESFLDNDYILYAPKDIWVKNGTRGSTINMGFSIWKNCERTKYINRIWIEQARSKCKKVANIHPRQQNVFDKCIFNILKKSELKYLDHNLVGLPYSSFIKQTKKTKPGWEKLGSPNYNICKLST